MDAYPRARQEINPESTRGAPRDASRHFVCAFPGKRKISSHLPAFVPPSVAAVSQAAYAPVLIFPNPCMRCG